MKQLIVISCLLLCLSCISCHKDEASPYAGTSWECREDGSLLVFTDNTTGIYYCKSSIDDVVDELYSSFDHVYAVSGNEITIHIQFTKRVFVIDGTVQEDVITTKGSNNIMHFVKIQHKTPSNQQ